MHLISSEGHLALASSAILKGIANINEPFQGRPHLIVAAGNGHTEIVKLYLQAGADPNAIFEGSSGLTYATEAGHLEVVRALVEGGADINFRAKLGLTPLYIATGAGRLELVKLLLEKGADKDIPDMNGNSPIIIAADLGFKEVAEELLKGTLPQRIGRALSCAVLKGHQSTVEVLNRAGVEIDFKLENDTTPLFHACLEGNSGMVQKLLDLGANVRNFLFIYLFIFIFVLTIYIG